MCMAGGWAACAAHVSGAGTGAGNMGGGAPRRSAPAEADSTSKAVRASWAPWAPAVTRASLRAASPARSAAGERMVARVGRQNLGISVRLLALKMLLEAARQPVPG